MRFSTLFLTALSLVHPFSAAQGPTTTTSSSASATTTTLPDLLNILPRCALTCLADAAKSISCPPTDFTCLCSKSSDLVAQVGPCIISGSGCKPDDVNQIRKLAPSLCGIVSADQNATDVAVASSLVSSALATITGTPSATASPSSGNGAVRVAGGGDAAALLMAGLAIGFGILGALIQT